MRIVVFTIKDHMFSNMLLRELIKERDDVIAVVESGVLIPKRGTIESFKYVIEKSGMLYFISKLMEYSSFKLHKFLAGKKKLATYWMRKKKVRNYVVKDINSEKAITLVKSLAPDLVICFNFNQIIKKEMLSVAKFINLHPAPLPRYGGVAPHFWVIRHNEKETSVSVHYIDITIDLGPIILQDKVTIDKKDSVYGLLMKCGKIGVGTLLRAVKMVELGNAKPKKQDSKKATYFSWPTPEDLKEFHKMGKKQARIPELLRMH